MGCSLNKLEKREEKRPGNIYSTLKRPQVETKVDVTYEYCFLEFTTLTAAELPRSSATRLASLRDLPDQLLELYQQGFSLAALHPFVQPTRRQEKILLEHIFRAILVKKTNRSQKAELHDEGYTLELDYCSSLEHLADQKLIPEFIKKAPHCEHAFCNACITQWFSQQQTCPVDRSVVTVAHLRPVPRIMRNMLSKLQIACDNAVFGCSAVVRLDNLMSHLSDCEHNPKRPVTCEQGCGLEMPKDELPNHNCIKHLRSVVQQQQSRIAELEKTSAEHKHQLAEQKRDIQLLKAYMRAIRSVNPNLQNLEETIEYNEILEWVNSLQPARVTRWGGMISTPDAVLQAVIKRSLVESGCPASIVNELIENAHERSWPQGLATLETRQMNRRYYENYVAKRIPGKQAVVVMACENQHMGDDMVQEPGLVMIFAHGVEEI